MKGWGGQNSIMERKEQEDGSARTVSRKAGGKAVRARGDGTAWRGLGTKGCI